MAEIVLLDSVANAYVASVSWSPPQGSIKQSARNTMRSGRSFNNWDGKKDKMSNWIFALALSTPSADGPTQKELVALPADIIFASSTPVVATLLEETNKIPIVFAERPLIQSSSGFARQPRASRGKNATGLHEPTNQQLGQKMA